MSDQSSYEEAPDDDDDELSGDKQQHHAQGLPFAPWLDGRYPYVPISGEPSDTLPAFLDGLTTINKRAKRLLSKTGVEPQSAGISVDTNDSNWRASGILNFRSRETRKGGEGLGEHTIFSYHIVEIPPRSLLSALRKITDDENRRLFIQPCIFYAYEMKSCDLDLQSNEGVAEQRRLQNLYREVYRSLLNCERATSGRVRKRKQDKTLVHLLRGNLNRNTHN